MKSEEMMNLNHNYSKYPYLKTRGNNYSFIKQMNEMCNKHIILYCSIFGVVYPIVTLNFYRRKHITYNTHFIFHIVFRDIITIFLKTRSKIFPSN